MNFKRYLEGERAVELARVCKKAEEETGVRIIAVPQLSDLARCLETGAECWTQRYEPEAVGNTGTLLNHSDYPIEYEMLKAQCAMLNRITKCVCVNGAEEAVRVAELGPEYIAYEPHELIGNREKSVASERPEEIREIMLNTQCCSSSLQGVAILIGAGIHSAEDVRVGLEMGAAGVLVATDVVKAEDPEKELRDLAEAFKWGIMYT